MAWRRMVLLTIAALLAGAVTGCDSTSPAEALRHAAELAQRAGSVRVEGTADWPRLNDTLDATPFQGTLSWMPDPAGEFTVPSDHTAVRYTADGQYLTGPPERGFDRVGKPWLRHHYWQLGGSPDPLDPATATERWRVAITKAFPAPYAAMLSQAPDLRLVGDEQRDGTASWHYAGTIGPKALAEDAEVGLSRKLIQRHRDDLAEVGAPALHLDVWLDRDGYPVRVESRRTGGGSGVGGDRVLTIAKQLVDVPVLEVGRYVRPVITMDYRDYGKPAPVTVPPEDQVLQW